MLNHAVHVTPFADGAQNSTPVDDPSAGVASSVMVVVEH
jgi:hypothetical protein